MSWQKTMCRYIYNKLGHFFAKIRPLLPEASGHPVVNANLLDANKADPLWPTCPAWNALGSVTGRV